MEAKFQSEGIHKTELPFLSRYSNDLEEFVYGGIDGSITTFAVVSGATGAGFSPEIILVLGFANLLADGLSMSVGSYLSARTAREHYVRHKKIEYSEIEECPELETEEIRVIYRAKGFDGDLLEQVVKVITADKDRWVNEMMKHELEMVEEKRSPLRKATATYVSFIAVGFIPMLIYLVSIFQPIPIYQLFILSAILTFLAFTVIGYLKAKLNKVNLLRGIGETVGLGSIAAAVAFLAGHLLEKLIA